MKKQTLLFLSLFVSAIGFTQISPSFGIRAGVSYAGMRGDAVNSLNNILDFANGMITTNDRTGFFAGTYVNIPVANVFSVEPALYYSQKGYELRGSLNLKGLDFLNASAKAALNLQYIDFPVLLKADISGLQLFAGPQISYLAKADLHTTAGAFGFNVLNSKMDAAQQFNRWDAGLTAGIGYRFPIGFSVTASYDYGLSKADANKSLSSYNQSFKAGIGFSF